MRKMSPSLDHQANKARCKQSIASIKKFIAYYMIDEGPKEELLSAIHDYAGCQIKNALALASVNPSLSMSAGPSGSLSTDRAAFPAEEGRGLVVERTNLNC